MPRRSPRDYLPENKTRPGGIAAFFRLIFFSRAGRGFASKGTGGRLPKLTSHMSQGGRGFMCLCAFHKAGEGLWIISRLSGIFENPEVKSDLVAAPDSELNPDLPQFPVGTQVALLRQMMLIDDRGAVEASPITESLQTRVYRAITARHDHNNVTIDWPAARTEQDFYEIRLSRTEFLAGHACGLRAVGQSETEFPIFQTQGS